MGDSSVVECVRPGGNAISAFTSWNFQRENNRIGVVRTKKITFNWLKWIDKFQSQNIIRLLEARSIDGRIYCRIERDAISIVNGQVFNLETQNFYLLLAGGPFATVNSVGTHGINRGVSSDRYWLVDQDETTTTENPTEDPIYDGCGTTKLCFGIPSNCVSTRNCDLLSTVFNNGGNFEFELLSASKKNHLI